jgi:PleD family two-component response regulator
MGHAFTLAQLRFSHPETMDTQEPRYPRAPLCLMVTSQEWVSLSLETVFAPRGYAVLRSGNGEQGLRRVLDNRPDLLLVEKDLRDMAAAEFCRELNARMPDGSAYPTCVIASSPWSREEKLDTLRAGAWDVYSLPMDGEELFLKVDKWVRAKLAADLEREQGLLDPDTGLYNTQGLLRRIAELSAGAMRYGRPIGCVIVSSEPAQAPGGGPAAGQVRTWTAAAARTVATTLQNAGRASDAVGRLSATEFVVIAPDTDPTGMEGLVRRLRRAMEAAPVEQPLTLRFGYYAVPSFGAESIAPTELLVRAADALRRAEADDRAGGSTRRPNGGHNQN